MKILVTGANGFVGRALCASLLAAGLPYRGAIRRPESVPSHPRGADIAYVGDIGPDTDWRQALEGVTAVVHLAARVHVMEDEGPDALAEYRRINVAGTQRLARSAAEAGVQRFIYLSTVKVHGEATTGPAFDELSPPAPSDPYAVSKWEAENVLRDIAANTGLEVVVLRPPLVYGPGVKGNFLRLLQLVERRTPLPIRCIDNRRSLLYVRNLISAVMTCIKSPEAAGHTYLVSDDDVSTPDLVRSLAIAFEMAPPVLLPIPLWLLRSAGRLAGQAEAIERLTASLQVDSGRIRNELGWAPVFTLPQGIYDTVRWHSSHKKLEH